MVAARPLALRESRQLRVAVPHLARRVGREASTRASPTSPLRPTALARRAERERPVGLRHPPAAPRGAIQQTRLCLTRGRERRARRRAPLGPSITLVEVEVSLES
eukprot:scaffold30298_cov30-Tisochrysis_lutea.AAC.1